MKILLTDDEKYLRISLGDALRAEGFDVVEAEDGAAAVKTVKKESPDAVILDYKMPGMDGIETLCEIKKLSPMMPVIMLTGYGDVPAAVAAMKNGACDFLGKPPDMELLSVIINNTVKKNKLIVGAQKIAQTLNLSLEQHFGRSQAIKKVIEDIKMVADTDVSILLQGETGTGKSYAAEIIHNLSKRGSNPLVRIDMGVVPEALAESELFGYKKGAFTSAIKDKNGYFESANGGTIFMDEMENTTPFMQGKLLSVIEKRQIYPVGAAAPSSIDIRIISATNKDVDKCIKDKELREDFFFRVGEYVITMPPLRDRRDDIAFFANKFVFEISAELNKNIKGFTDGAINTLAAYKWPGNIRELKSVIKRAVLKVKGDIIDKNDLTFIKTGEDGVPSLKNTLKEHEQMRIQEALGLTGGNKMKAAKMLDISYKNMISKVKEYGL